MLASAEAERFVGKTAAVRDVQEELLREEIIRPNVDCEYGRRHGFTHAMTADEFRRAAPLVDFEDIRSFVDRMAQGEKDVLTCERVLCYFKTSGSTSAPKLIPVTPTFVRQKGRSFGIFWHLIYSEHPVLQKGRWIANFGDLALAERTAGGSRILSETSFWNERMQGLQKRSRWPIPPSLREIRDPELRYFAAARFALQGDLHGVMCLNPSTLLVFCQTIETHRQDLLAGLADGSLGYPGPLEPEDRQRLEPHLEADASRSARLSERSGPALLPALWPDLDLVICWQSQGVRPYLKLCQSHLGTVPMRDYITQASEGIMAIPLEDSFSGGLLSYTTHFYEFVPEAEVESEQPRTLLADELEIDGRYELVVTTAGGLYRYRMGDIFRVVDRRGAVPVIEFLHRKGKTSSLTGEKLTEAQVLEAGRLASDRAGGQPAQFLCFPRSGTAPHYGILMAWDVDEPRRAEWTRLFEEALQGLNSEYSDKRSSGRLGEPQPLAATQGDFVALRRQKAEQSRVSEEQIKLSVLTNELDLDEILGGSSS